MLGLMVRPKNRPDPAWPGLGKFVITDDSNCLKWNLKITLAVFLLAGPGRFLG